MQRKKPPMDPANARWQARRRRLIGYGQWEPFVEAQPVRDHLVKVMNAGMPIAAVCEKLGLPHSSSLQHLLYGRAPYGPAQQVRRETAELVLAYWPSPEDLPEGTRIDPTGTRRRVQALAVRGWPRHWMAVEMGMSATAFKKALHKDRVTARLARAVAALYDQRWNQDPFEHGLMPKSVDRVRADAARAGWHGPLAWDDDTIDNPAAVPMVDAEEPVVTEGTNVANRWLMGESVVLDSKSRLQVLVHLFEWTGQSSAQIAERLEMTPSAAEQAWFRHVRKARAEGRPVPWRRVWELRDKTLKQDSMGEAA